MRVALSRRSVLEAGDRILTLYTFFAGLMERFVPYCAASKLLYGFAKVGLPGVNRPVPGNPSNRWNSNIDTVSIPEG